MPCLLWISCCLCLSAGMVGICVGSSCPHLDHPICSLPLSLPCRTCYPLITHQYHHPGVQTMAISLVPWHADPTGFLFRTSLEKLRVYAASVPAFWVSLVLMRPGYDGLDRGSRGQAASHQLLPPRPTLSAAITARPHLQRHGEEGGGKAWLAFGPIRPLGKASRPF